MKTPTLTLTLTFQDRERRVRVRAVYCGKLDMQFSLSSLLLLLLSSVVVACNTLRGRFPWALGKFTKQEYLPFPRFDGSCTEGMLCISARGRTELQQQ